MTALPLFPSGHFQLCVCMHTHMCVLFYIQAHTTSRLFEALDGSRLQPIMTQTSGFIVWCHLLITCILFQMWMCCA